LKLQHLKLIAMCVNFITPTSEQLRNHFKAPLETNTEWKSECWQDYAAPIIIGDKNHRHALLGLYSMIPKKYMPPNVKRFSTMNARAETVATLRSYAHHWQNGQLCLVPMTAYFEPNYEYGKAERWKICMADESPFAVAGLFRTWKEIDGSISYSFTQLTINADNDPMMRRFHKPNEEKRSLVILPEDMYDDWLDCRDPIKATTFLKHYPAELLNTYMANKLALNEPKATMNLELF
jgi:putative SOS response-associated peptidase YedK